MMLLPLSRGDIVEVDLGTFDLGDQKSKEKAGKRPCIVIQNNKGNEHSDLTIVVPLTDMRQYKELPVQEPVTAAELGFEGSKDSVVECGHVRTVDRALRVKGFKGKLHPDVMARVDRALAASVGL